MAATPGAVAQLPPGGSFLDDDRSFAEGSIEAVLAAGITAGCGPAMYCPEGKVTRAQAAVFLARALGETSTEASGRFLDVAVGAWYAIPVERMAELGIIAGYPDGTFRPDRDVSREEIAAMLVRSLSELPSETLSQLR
jgi:hypothetical protein